MEGILKTLLYKFTTEMNTQDHLCNKTRKKNSSIMSGKKDTNLAFCRYVICLSA